MTSSVRFAPAVALALVAVGGATASTSVYAVTPSAAQAKRATRFEVMTRYTILDARMSHHAVVLRVGCNRVSQRLYRCSFSGQTATDLYEYILSGKSMVRLDKAAHAKLYAVSCSTYNYSNYISFDFGC